MSDRKSLILPFFFVITFFLCLRYYLFFCFYHSVVQLRVVSDVFMLPK